MVVSGRSYAYFKVTFFVFSALVAFFILQRFCLRGRLIFGPDARSVFLTIVLIVAPVSVFCVFVARKLLDDFPDHYGISIMAIVVVFTLCVSLFPL